MRCWDFPGVVSCCIYVYVYEIQVCAEPGPYSLGTSNQLGRAGRVRVRTNGNSHRKETATTGFGNLWGVAVVFVGHMCRFLRTHAPHIYAVVGKQYIHTYTYINAACVRAFIVYQTNGAIYS